MDREVPASPFPQQPQTTSDQAPLTKDISLKPSAAISEPNITDQSLPSDSMVSEPIPKQGPRSLDTAYNNILFRFFIWGDVVKELKSRKPLLGTDFGYPFRSRSLEVLGWADDAWRNDGWIALHNSYLDLIYRAGVVGVLVVCFIFWQAIRIIYWTIKTQTRTGILISGLLMYWLCAANFIEFLELPYTAIVFWTFLGMTMAYIKTNNQPAHESRQ
jgi:O-antigen ligase